MHSFVLLLAARTGWFAEGRFLGRVLDEWAVDAQEFIRVKLPHLLVVAAIAFVLMRLLAPDHLSHDPRGGAALGHARAHRPGEDGGRDRPHHRAGHHLADRRIADSGCPGRESGAAAGLGRDCRNRPRPGGPEHRQGRTQRHPHPRSRTSSTWETRCGWPGWPEPWRR